MSTPPTTVSNSFKARHVVGRILVLLVLDVISIFLSIIITLSIFASSEVTGDWQQPTSTTDSHTTVVTTTTDPTTLNDVVGYIELGILYFGIPTLLILGLQVILLIPVLGRPSAQPGSGKSVIASGVVIGLIASTIVTGLIMAVGEWILIESPTVMHELEKPGQSGFDQVGPGLSWIIFLIAFPIFWGLFGLLFSWTLIRSTAPNRLKKLILYVLFASAAEYVLLIPISALVNRRTDCYCVTGSFFALVYSVSALVLLAGPFILLLFWNHRYRAHAKTLARSQADD